MYRKICITLFFIAISNSLFPQGFGTVIQGETISNEFKGKEFHFSGYVKASKDIDGSGNLWFRVDRMDSKMGFFENMEDNPIRSTEWKKYEISGRIDAEAKDIVFGVFLSGQGKIWADDFSLEIKDSLGVWKKHEIKNPGFEEAENNAPKDWKTRTTKYNFITDSVNVYKGKYSLKIESLPKPAPVVPVYVKDGAIIKLPPPSVAGTMSVEKAMFLRRSVRVYENDSITLQDVSQMLWAAYGVSDTTTYPGYMLRTAPSAGACYPFEIYIVAGMVKGLKAGVYRYLPKTNDLKLEIVGDLRSLLCDVSLRQSFVLEAPASIVWTAVFERTTKKYRKRGRERYVCMDLGHSGENVYLQAEAMNFGTCAIGAFWDKGIINLFKLPKEEEPLYIMPFGKLTKADLEKRTIKSK